MIGLLQNLLLFNKFYDFCRKNLHSFCCKFDFILFVAISQYFVDTFNDSLRACLLSTLRFIYVEVLLLSTLNFCCEYQSPCDAIFFVVSKKIQFNSLSGKCLSITGNMSLSNSYYGDKISNQHFIGGKLWGLLSSGLI